MENNYFLDRDNKEKTPLLDVNLVTKKNVELINTTNENELKEKYGIVYQIDITVDEDDVNDGRTLRFIFKKPTAASFNRYLKTASKNMAVSTANFVMDNIIVEHKETLQREGDKYPGLALNIGQKLMSAIGMGDNINFRKL